MQAAANDIILHPASGGWFVSVKTNFCETSWLPKMHGGTTGAYNDDLNSASKSFAPNNNKQLKKKCQSWDLHGTIIETHDPTLSNFTATSHQLGILKAGPLCLNHSEITTSAETTARSPHRASAGQTYLGKSANYNHSAHVVLYITIKYK